MRTRFGVAAFIVLAASAGCAQPAAVQKLETVAPLPSPAVPQWITSVAPLGSAQARSQIRVIFAGPLLPVEQLGSPSEQDALGHFSIAPALPGHFVVLTPRMIGFQSDAGLPSSTRVRVTVSAGLHDLQGHALSRDLAWTFETQALVFATPSPDGSPGVSGLKPVIHITANGGIDESSLRDHAAFRTGDAFTGVTVVRESPSPDSQGVTYDVTPERELAAASRYDFTLDQGVMPERGNLPSNASLKFAVTTYSPLAVGGAKATADPMASVVNARFSGGDPVLTFNNALDPKTFVAHVRLDPSPSPAGKTYALTGDGNGIFINPYALAPRTAYAFTIDSGMRDVFGQTLGQEVRGTFKTGDFAPYFWAPGGYNGFASSQNLQLDFSALNIPGNTYSARYRVLQPLDVLQIDPSSASNVLSGVAAQQFAIAGAVHNRQSVIHVPLRAKLGGPTGVLAYMASAQTGASPYTGVVQMTDLGVFAEWFPASGSIMVQRLSDGSPVAGASVDVYRSNVFGSAPVATDACAHGTTSAAGIVSITGESVQRCYAGNRPADEAPELFVVARSGRDWTYLRTFGWSGIYMYAINVNDGTWSSGQPISRGTIYSDRQMYQPGERGWFTAVCYVLQNGELRADRNASYRVVLRDPNGVERKLPAQTTNAYATFSFPIDFTKTQALGYYTLEATGPSGVKITGNLRVAEFHPPNFAVDLKLDREFAAAGDTVSAQGRARYLFGTPMSGNGTVHVTREQASFTPKGWEDYWFGRQWFWPEQTPSVDSDAGAQTVPFDAKGQSAAQITVARDLPYAMTYRVDLETTDVSNLSSSATQSFTALPSALSIGLKSDFVGTVNAPIATAVVVTDAKGVPEPGVHVHLELQRMDYSGVTQVIEGSESARDQVQYTTVSQTDVTSATAPQNATLQTKDAGSYRIRASFSGQSDQASDTDTIVWVTGPGQAQWAQQTASQLQLQLDKKMYNPGDVATVAVASPYDRADLYLAVVRDRVLWQTLVHINGSAPRVRIPIANGMFPNAAVQGVLVRRGSRLNGANARGIDSLVRIGMVPLALDIRPNYVRVGVKPAQARTLPGSRQTVRLHATGTGNKPLRAQFTVIVADDAILRLSGYRPPDLVQIVLQSQPISARFGDSRPDITLVQPTNTNQKGWGYGGGFLAGAASTQVRTKFVPLAYFQGAVQTDNAGNADVSFDVPDNLTTWRVMAVAVTADAKPRFGSNDATFIATKPLVTQPLLPQFARPGDQFDGGMTLMNSQNGSVDARTQGSVTGALRFTSPAGERVQAQQQFAPGLNAWRFGMTVTGAGAASLQFNTDAASVGADAFRIPFDVRTSDVSESVIEGGATQTTARVPLTIGDGPGAVHVTLAGSPVAFVVSAAKAALSGDTGVLLPEIAGRAGVAASVIAIQNVAGKAALPVDGMRAAHDAVSALARLQRDNGGFGFWPGDSSVYPEASAQAYRALGYAAHNGVNVSPHMLANAKSYVVRALADPAAADKSCTDPSCKNSMRLSLLRALAANADHRTDFLAQLFADRSTLSLAERAQLALLLSQTPGWSAQASTLRAELAKNAYVTGRYENIQGGAPYESAADTQAAYLQLLVAQKASQREQDRALHALLAQQCPCGSAGASSAATMEALAAYTQAHSERPRFTADVTVDGAIRGSAQFAALTDAPKTIDLPALSRGAHNVTLTKRGSGTLHYGVTYEYRLNARAPGRLAGLRVRRNVRAVNTAAVLATYDLAAAQPLALAAGSVYDIGVEVIADHPVDNVLIADPLPAGFEALDTSFLTTASYYQPLAGDWQIDYQKTFNDRIEAFARHLDAGVYSFHYLARSVTPGDYIWPGTSAYLLNAPEQFGRSAFGEVRVTI